MADYGSAKEKRIAARAKLFGMISRSYIPKTPPSKEEGDWYQSILDFVESGQSPRYRLRKMDEKSPFIRKKDECCGGGTYHYIKKKHKTMKHAHCGDCKIKFIRLVLESGERYPFTDTCFRGFKLGDKAISVHCMSDERFKEVMHEFGSIGMPLWIEGEKTKDGFTCWMMDNKEFKVTRPTEYQARKAIWSQVYPFYGEEFRKATEKLDGLTKSGRFTDDGVGFLGEKV